MLKVLSLIEKIDKLLKKLNEQPKNDKQPRTAFDKLLEYFTSASEQLTELKS